MNKIKLITASAGSGKTHKLQETLAEYVRPDNPLKIRPEAVIATTFTIKAAQELKERARTALIGRGYFAESIRLEGALISTVHSVCTKLIEIFSYESGLSPQLSILPEGDEALYFNAALSDVIKDEEVALLENLKARLFCPSFGSGEYDWRDDVKKIIESARSNGINSDGLKKSYEKSWASIEPCFGTSINESEFESRIVTHGEELLTQFQALQKLGQNDKKFMDSLEDFLSKLKKGYNIKWDAWQALSQASLNSPGQKLATSYCGLIADYIHHPKFKSDYQQFLKTVFDIASRTIEAYQKYKEERGVIDFADMECKVLSLLDQPHVQTRIKEEFDLLMVDEFQDTNPIQLAIFLKLSSLIANVVWVGDQKQSIYGFRGSDPTLMQGLLTKMKDRFDYETLDTSYRSRPNLVTHANDLFTKVFEGKLPASQVQLKAHRKENAELGNAFEVWRIEKSGPREKGEKARRAIAHEMKVLLNSNTKVGIKGTTDEIRPLELKDISVLCRSNKNCVEMAALLKEYGLAVSLKQDGLLFLPESKLMMAALRYFAFPHDSLSIIEMKLLVDGKDNVEELLEERVNYVAEEKYAEYGKDHWFIKRIDEVRTHQLQLSPQEIVNYLLINLEMERVVSSWSEGDERFQNLLQFKNLAAEYEDSCTRLKMGATLGGFMLWLDSKEDEDLLHHGGFQSDNAITVMTWHRSKGLEWPVVVFNDCEKEERKNCFGIYVLSENELNPTDPLAGRYIQFWINPFHSSRKKDVPFIDQARSFPTSVQIAEACSAEAARLLYVGFTRARDYLYIPLQASKSAEIFVEVLGDACDLPKVAGDHALPWANSKTLSVRTFKDIEEAPDQEHAPKQVTVFKAFKGPEVHPNYKINPSAIEQLEQAQAKRFGSYGKRLNVKVKIQDSMLGDCLHDIAALDKLTIDDASRVLKNYNLENNLDASEIVHQLELFDGFLTTSGFSHSRRELPVTARINGQLIDGIIDHLAECVDGFVLIDHKSYQGANLEEKALSYSGQLSVYKKALKLTGKKVNKALIHFIVQGEIVEVVF